MQSLDILKTRGERDYELLDSGDEEKLERYGSVVLSRPDPQALWTKHLPQEEWQKAQAAFSRDATSAQWEFRERVPERWEVELSGLKFFVKPSSFKHVGLFPEQAPNWEWMRERITNEELRMKRTVSVLNLFGYTGGATLACAQAGAQVCHVDSSKVAVAWGRDNAALSRLHDKPVRWIIEDVVVFVKREIKRGHKYDGIILDPPAFGHGPNKEMWRIEQDFLPLLELCKQLLTPQPLFFLVNGYASGYSAITYANSISDLQTKYGGQIELGELTIEETGSCRLLPAGIFARWSVA